MAEFASKLVSVLNGVSDKQRETVAHALLNWVRMIPVDRFPSQEELVLTTLERLTAKFLPSDSIELRDWLSIFRKSQNHSFMTELRKKYLEAVKKNGTIESMGDFCAKLRMVLIAPN